MFLIFAEFEAVQEIALAAVDAVRSSKSLGKLSRETLFGTLTSEIHVVCDMEEKDALACAETLVRLVSQAGSVNPRVRLQSDDGPALRTVWQNR